MKKFLIPLIIFISCNNQNEIERKNIRRNYSKIIKNDSLKIRNKNDSLINEYNILINQYIILNEKYKKQIETNSKTMDKFIIISNKSRKLEDYLGSSKSNLDKIQKRKFIQIQNKLTNSILNSN